MKVLSYTAINPHRRFPESEASIRAMRGAAQTIFDERDDPATPWYQTVLEKYRHARRLTLEGGYDALLTVESDMLIPPNALERLAALDAPVAYGVYVLRHGAPYWNLCVALEEEVGFFLTDKIVRNNAPMEWAAAHAGQPFQVYGSGFGCTLIRRDVLEQLEFRNHTDAESFYCDWLFAADCNKLKIKQMTDPAVACGHYSDTGTLFPDITMPDLFRREA